MTIRAAILSSQGLGIVKRKASVHGFSVRVLIGLAIVLNEIVFVNFLASAGVEFVLSSAVVTIALLLQLRFAVRRTRVPRPTSSYSFSIGCFSTWRRKLNC